MLNGTNADGTLLQYPNFLDTLQSLVHDALPLLWRPPLLYRLCPPSYNIARTILQENPSMERSNLTTMPFRNLAKVIIVLLALYRLFRRAYSGSHLRDLH